MVVLANYMYDKVFIWLSTSPLASNDCSLERKAALTPAGNPWYNVSLVLGGSESGWDTWAKRLKSQWKLLNMRILLFE